MSVKRAAQTVAVWCDNIICVTINAIFSKNLWHNSIIQTQEQSNMTTWAIQPSHWGNQVLIGAEFKNDFAAAEDTALDMATDTMEKICIFKVGTKADIKWMEVN
tara:strand:+ start:653 stop:964 length:312 start_codon:yes stop_codon:yes gene_type:complete